METHGTLRRPKLLFLASPFPPLRAVACVRTWNIAKHLARHGWDVTVVTPDPSIYRNPDDVHKVSHQLQRERIRRIVTDHRWRFLRPESLICWNTGAGWVVGGTWRRLAAWLQIDAGIGWIKAAENACASLRPEDVDVILATGSPFSAFKLAKRLSDKLGRPYVLDYRDSWTENIYASASPRARVICEERKLLASCAAVTVVSPSWAEAMDHRFGLGSAKLHVITNGYDPEEISRIKPYNFGHFAIVYTGSFHPPKRAITPLMVALKSIKEGTIGKQWYFHYYGKDGQHVREEASKHGILDRVVFHGNVTRCEALSAVAGANIAVVITSIEESVTKKDAGMIPAKLFESLGMKTTTLIVGPPGSDVDNIVEHAGSARRFVATEVDRMAVFVNSVLSGQVPPSRNVERYAWNVVAGKMDGVLREAIGVRVRAKQGCETNSGKALLFDH